MVRTWDRARNSVRGRVVEALDCGEDNLAILATIRRLRPCPFFLIWADGPIQGTLLTHCGLHEAEGVFGDRPLLSDNHCCMVNVWRALFQRQSGLMKKTFEH